MWLNISFLELGDIISRGKKLKVINLDSKILFLATLIKNSFIATFDSIYQKTSTFS